MLFVLVYFLFAVAITLALPVSLWKCRGNLSAGRIVLYICIPLAIWVAPFLVEKFYGIHIVGSKHDLPVDKSFLDGNWIGQCSSSSERIEIAISNEKFQARNLPYTGKYREGGNLQFQSYSGLVEYNDWASGAAILFNGFDPVYIARQSGQWRLVQNLDVTLGSQIVYKKSEAEETEALKP